MGRKLRVGASYISFPVGVARPCLESWIGLFTSFCSFSGSRIDLPLYSCVYLISDSGGCCWHVCNVVPNEGPFCTRLPGWVSPLSMTSSLLKVIEPWACSLCQWPLAWMRPSTFVPHRYLDPTGCGCLSIRGIARTSVRGSAAGSYCPTSLFPGHFVDSRSYSK
jgi:hypothetical protein